MAELRRKKEHWELLRKLNSAPAADAALEALIEDCSLRIGRLAAHSKEESGDPEARSSAAGREDDQQS